ncbi:MAG: galactokinase [Planctomycetes bacterium]|nr:galactokinase [Planctomycetota bacterium]NOG54071.1 galactokinase [Planctomycetota bacterium]
MTHPQSATSISDLVERASAEFQNRFGHPPAYRAAAPGRVNLIGEHVDYNGGFVLPIAIARWTVVVAAPADRADGSGWTVIASDLHAAEASFSPGKPTAEPTSWVNYVHGVADLCRAEGLTTPPMDMVIASSVPIGAGLSSSAALEVAVATVLERACGKTMEPVAKAHLCQQAEHRFAGVPCGIMDQTISCLGRADHALLLDCQSGESIQVPMPDRNDAAVMIIDTRVHHELSAGEYAKRREQCQAALICIRDRVTTAFQSPPQSLRDVSPAMLESCGKSIDPLLLKRAGHVITEMARTEQAAEALQCADLTRFGQLMNESHVSLRDDFEVSCAELDTLVESAWAFGEANPGTVFGCRMTGGGFGGCAVALVEPGAVGTLSEAIRRDYRNTVGLDPAIFVTHAVDGARSL